MRQLAIILTALTVAATQIDAGILDWFRGSPAKDSSADATTSFERGITRLRDHQNRIFDTSKTIEITYDVKRTDSLIEPVVGIVSIVVKSPPEGPWSYNDLRLAFRDGSWVISSYNRTFLGYPVPTGPDGRVWKLMQACFVSDEAAEEAVAGAPCQSQADHATPADKTPAEATPPSRFVTITKSLSVGADVLPAGTRFELVSKDGSEVHTRYRGAEYVIPVPPRIWIISKLLPSRVGEKGLI